jgi:hypothetical protein
MDRGGASWGENGVVLLAVCLRMLAGAIALASVRPWGGRVPSSICWPDCGAPQPCS